MQTNMTNISSLSKQQQWCSLQSKPFSPSFEMNYSRHIRIRVQEGSGYA